MLGLIRLARGDSRLLLVGALGYTHGDTGVPFLRSLLSTTGRGSVHLRIDALGALVSRVGPAARADLVPLLSGVPAELQVSAALALAGIDDGLYADEIFGWFERRLKATSRDAWELSGVLRYALRVDALAQVAVRVDKYSHRMRPHEAEPLERVWPSERRRRFLMTGDPVTDGPAAAALREWDAPGAAGRSDDDEPSDITVEFVGPIIERLRRRAARE